MAFYCIIEFYLFILQFPVFFIFFYILFVVVLLLIEALLRNDNISKTK